MSDELELSADDDALPFGDSLQLQDESDETPQELVAPEAADGTLKSILHSQNVADDAWDAVIVTDGSGTTWKNTMGWGSVLITKSSIHRRLFYGGASHGTSQLAEIMAVLHPLLALAELGVGDRQHGYRVHVFTDSKYVADRLKLDLLKAFADMKAHLPMWLAIHGCQRRGLDIVPHHLPRETIDLNKLCHDLANLAREGQIGLTSGLGWDAETTNPT